MAGKHSSSSSSSDNNNRGSPPPPPPTNAVHHDDNGTRSFANDNQLLHPPLGYVNYLGLSNSNLNFNNHPNFIGLGRSASLPPQFNHSSSSPRLNHPFTPPPPEISSPFNSYVAPMIPFLPMVGFLHTVDRPSPLPQAPPNPQEVPPSDTTNEVRPVENRPRVSSANRIQKRRERTSSKLKRKKDKSETITPPFRWSTNKRCRIYTMETLLEQKKIPTISGEVKCKKCDKTFGIAFDLQSKFDEIKSFLHNNDFQHRAPVEWMKPTLPDCIYCQQTNVGRPISSNHKKNINWLFLFLGGMLGCCKLKELRYFCKHNKIHRTAAKDRLVYLVYLGICRQLNPTGPFDL